MTLGQEERTSDGTMEALWAAIATVDPGEKLPPERELSRQLGVARETLRRRLDDLEGLGRVVRRHGSGTYVAERKVTDRLWIISFSEDMRSRGLTPSSRLISAEREPAGNVIGARLGVSPGTPTLSVRRVRLADGEPMALEEVHLDASTVPDLDPEELGSASLYELLSRRYGIVATTGEQRIEAAVLDAGDAELLHVAPYSPALVVDRVTRGAGGAPIEHAVSLYRADRYRIEVTSRRPPPLRTTDP